MAFDTSMDVSLTDQGVNRWLEIVAVTAMAPTSTVGVRTTNEIRPWPPEFESSQYTDSTVP